MFDPAASTLSDYSAVIQMHNRIVIAKGLQIFVINLLGVGPRQREVISRDSLAVLHLNAKKKLRMLFLDDATLTITSTLGKEKNK